MKQERQIDLVRRVLAHVDAKTTDTDPRGGATIGVDAYASEARLAREIDVLFRDLPLAIAHSSELGKPGDFLTHDLSGAPLLVVRRDDGGLDGFLNVCRHRGTRVEGASRGTKQAFSCPYHGWTYGRRGQLVTIPHERGFGSCVDKDKRGLTRVLVGEAAGMIFARPRPVHAGSFATEGPTMESWLGAEIAEDFEGFGLPKSVVWGPRSITRDISWKLAIDIFLETYHLRPTHKSTIYPMFFDNIGLVDRVGGHHLRNVFPKRSIRELRDQPEASWQLRVHANVLYHLFPNTLVLVQPDHAAVLHVWPAGTRRTIIASYMLIPEPALGPKANAYWQANADILYGATDEDFTMGESIQRGLGSGANEDLVFGAYEHALTYFHDEIARQASKA